MDILPPEATERIARIGFLARGRMAGPITGRHASPNRGASVEFAEHRPYSPGDSPRDLDWRVLGKANRYYIKQYIEETNLRATLLVDASGSMGYRGEAAAEGLSKFDYACRIAAALAYLFVKQQDAAGLVTFDTAVRNYLPPKTRNSQIRAVVEALSATKPSKQSGVAATFHDIAERIPQRGLVLVISDLFDDPEDILDGLQHFAHRKHEVVIFHVMADEERHFPFKKFHRFRDLEGVDHAVNVEPNAIRREYLKRVKSFLEKIEKGCGAIQASYVPMNTKTPYDEALIQFLAQRRGK